ncbi:CP11A protein, partial [Phainopepla nitens]|nr:CP11A protein [Phainopepla nitens]
ADRCIQSVYRDVRLRRKGAREPVGVLGNLILRDALPLDDIRASVTEMMAGGVDTVRGHGDMGTRGHGDTGARGHGGTLLAGQIVTRAGVGQGEGPAPWWHLSRRLHPVAVTLQRYTTHEVILQDYRIPP